MYLCIYIYSYIYLGSKAKQTAVVRVEMLRAVKDKLPAGQYVL